MKKYLLSITLLMLTVIIVASCVKDRVSNIKNVIPPPVNTGNDTVIYYWNFNVDSLGILTNNPTIHIVSGASLSYNGASFDTVQPGTNLNAVGTDTVLISGSAALRLRNPSTSFTLNLPTTGYKNIVLKYAEQRTNKGAQTNTVTYTVDGTTWINTAIANYATYTVDSVDITPEAFQLVSLDFSSDSLVNNNPNFKVMISFSLGNTNTSGNDRFDNITLYGVKK